MVAAGTHLQASIDPSLVSFGRIDRGRLSVAVTSGGCPARPRSGFRRPGRLLSLLLSGAAPLPGEFSPISIELAAADLARLHLAPRGSPLGLPMIGRPGTNPARPASDTAAVSRNDHGIGRNAAVRDYHELYGPPWASEHVGVGHT